jgi:hypothetical protein
MCCFQKPTFEVLKRRFMYENTYTKAPVALKTTLESLL